MGLARAAGNRSHRYGILVAKEFDVVGTAELLSIAGRGKDLDRLAAAGSEYGRKGPATQESSFESILSSVEGRLVNDEHVVHEFTVISLPAVHQIQVIRIVFRVLAGRLNQCTGTECLGIGEVLLQGYAFPVVHLKGGKSGVVIAMTDAGIDSYA